MQWLRVEHDEFVVTVTLDRPPVNAVDREVMSEIAEVFEGLRDDRRSRAVIFTAAGDRAFMGGADLRSVGKPSDADTPASVTVDPGAAARRAMWAILDCPLPVIVAVNGSALGAGLAFAAVGDILLAAEGVEFGTPEIDVGLLGASAHLSMLVPRHKVRELYLTGERITAEELERFGAIRKVVPREHLLDTARELAANLTRKSPVALRLAKEALNRSEYLPLKEAYRLEQDYTNRLLGFEDSQEARDAFLEKRHPRWTWDEV